jgi:hypothetical protein
MPNIGDTMPPVGTRVRVHDLNLEPLGDGTFKGEVSFESTLSPETLADPRSELIKLMIESGVTTVRIELDNGETIYGFQCWWRSLEDQE